MDAFTLIDGIAAVVIILSAILAYSRGLVRETLAIGGWVLAAVAAFFLAPMAEPLMKEVPILRDFLGPSCELSMIAAFAAVFALALIVVSIITPVFASAVQHSALGGIDQGFGFLFGVARGVVLIAIVLLIYQNVFANDPVAMVEDSRTAAIFAQVSDAVSENVPEDAPGWIAARYDELISQCSANQTDA